MVGNMETNSRAIRTTVSTATASSWSYWFVFTYIPPASLVGRVAVMS
jgi:hypothetical protein